MGPPRDAGAAPYATDLLDGRDKVELASGVTAFAVPGHTKGSVLYHVDDGLLFTGDSLSWDPGQEQLTAFRGACWYSWEEQTASLDRFAASGLRFRRIFCGHGWSHDLDIDGLHSHPVDLVARMPAC